MTNTSRGSAVLRTLLLLVVAVITIRTVTVVLSRVPRLPVTADNPTTTPPDPDENSPELP